jgi:peroxiredoxin
MIRPSLSSLAGALGAALVLTAAAALPGSAAAAPSLVLKSPAPDFTLHAADGHNLRLQELRGQVVLVNFWATWCGPCREEMPKLDAIYRKYHGSGFTLLGVSIDDDAGNAMAVAKRLGVSFPVLLDTDKSVSKLYDLATMPSTVLIDRDGKVRYLNRGYREGVQAVYDEQIRTLLKE